MILFSSAMGKSGSTLLCNLQEQMLMASGIRSGQQALRKTFNGRFIHSFPAKTIIQLLYINSIFGSVVIKTHSPPTRYIKLLINLGIAKATYSYRDVRDVILSALDHGTRNRKDGDLSGVYADLYTVDQALKIGVDSIHEMQRWQSFRKVLFVRYEGLMENTLHEIRLVSDYLAWCFTDSDLKRIVEEQEKGKFQSHNYNKGTTYRYKTEMTAEQKEKCSALFGEFLTKIGYEA